MIRIAICDDDVNITEYIREYLEEKASHLYDAHDANDAHDAHDAKLDVAIFRSGEDFLHAIEQGAAFQIVFMDIQMGAMSGIDAGQALRGLPNGDDAIIVYISNHDSYFEELVQIGSFRFIRKPIDEKELNEVFGRALRQAMKMKYSEASAAPRLFKFMIGSDLHTVKTNEIAYMKNTKRTITLYVMNFPRRRAARNQTESSLNSDDNSISSANKFYSTIDDALKRLPEVEFVQCERSHIVNLGVVHRMENDSFVLADDKSTRIPIGKVFKQESKKAYFRYLEGL